MQARDADTETEDRNSGAFSHTEIFTRADCKAGLKNMFV
jgi:hypothetical protein